MGLWAQLYHLIAMWDYESHLTFLNLRPHSPLQQNWANNAYHIEILWRSTITIRLLMLYNRRSAIIRIHCTKGTQDISPIDTIAMKNKWVKWKDWQRFWQRIAVPVPFTGLLRKSRLLECVCICIAESQWEQSDSKKRCFSIALRNEIQLVPLRKEVCQDRGRIHGKTMKLISDILCF